MNAVYHIQVPISIPEDTSGYHLYIGIGSRHLSFAILNPAEREFVALQHFNLEKHDAISHCKDIIEHNEWLRKTYGQTEIIYNFSESILVPEKFYLAAINETSLELIYGDIHKGKQFSEHIPDWEVYHIYRVPIALHDALEMHFPRARFSHSFSCWLKISKRGEPNTNGEELYTIFYNNKLTISLLKDGNLQLLRSFEYETAEDVVYHLLNICQQYGIDCEKVLLNVSGLIADQSAMYTELQKYFILLRLQERPADFKYADVFDEYPAHFFTPIFNAALCG